MQRIIISILEWLEAGVNSAQGIVSTFENIANRGLALTDIGSDSGVSYQLPEFFLDHSAQLTMGLMLSIAVLAVFIAVALKERHAIASCGLALCSTLLVYILWSASDPTLAAIGFKEALCLLAITVFSLELALSLDSATGLSRMHSRMGRCYQLLTIGFAICLAIFHRHFAGLGAGGTGRVHCRSGVLVNSRGHQLVERTT